MRNGKERVGILTFHFSNHNYGAVLQTYASFTVLQRLGFHPCVINLLPHKQNGRPAQTLKRFIISHLNGSATFDRFRTRYLQLTDRVFPKSNLPSINDSFDIYYVGSDQVWRPEMARERLLNYFLDFADEEKLKISYAASFGLSEWDASSELTSKVGSLLGRFSHISVRELDGVKICEDTFGVHAQHVLDPTLLLTGGDYSKIFGDGSQSGGAEHEYVGFYLLADVKGITEIPMIARQQIGLPVRNLYGDVTRVVRRSFFRYRSVEDWLLGIKSASFVITDSFHCVIFSILFRKEFVCILRESGGVSRIKSLLGMLGIDDRCCDAETLDLRAITSRRIDYTAVHNRLDELRGTSYSFLKNALNVKD